jgi:MFS family permease
MLIAAGVVILAAFIVWERFQIQPLIPLDIFRNRNFSLMNWVGAVVSFGMLGLFLPLTIYLQSALGFSALKAGLTFVPMSIVSLLVAPNAGRLADRIGGKYILLTGLSLFGIGMGAVDWVASTTSDWRTFLPALIITGLGLGCTFAPLQTVAMRNIKPQLAGAASGIINTTRQLGGVIGSAVVGAVLQNRLATSLHDEAVAYSGQVPPGFRQRFIDGFSNAGKGGLEVGRGQTGAGQLPPSVPPQVAAQLERIFHDVFVNAFINAMRPTLIVPVAVLLLGAVSCLFIQRRKAAAEAAAAHDQQRAIAAASADG